MWLGAEFLKYSNFTVIKEPNVIICLNKNIDIYKIAIYIIYTFYTVRFALPGFKAKFFPILKI